MERMYVPVVEDNAISIAEDIKTINIARLILDKLSTCVISKDDKYKVLNLLNEYERECRNSLRNEYLYADHKAKKVSESLRDRLKLELIKEGAYYELGEDERDRQDSTSISKGATQDAGGEGWEESSLPF